jgi:hypothetical protein
MDPDTALQLLLLGVVMPLAASLATTAASWWSAKGIRPVDDRRDGRRAAWAAMLSPLALLACVQWVLLGGWSFPPQNALQQIPFVLLAAFVLGLAPGPAPAVIALVAGISRFVLATSAQHQADAMLAIAWGSGMLLLRPHARPTRGWTLLVPLGFTLAGAAVALVMTGSLKLAQLAGAAAMTLLGIFAVSLTRPRLTIAGPALSVFVAMLAVTLAHGAAFGDTPRWLSLAIGLGGPALAAGLVRWKAR